MDWEREDLFFQGDDWFQSLTEGIREARHSVFLEFYILENDSVGRALFAEAERAAHRGCQVRLLVDGVGSAAWLAAARDEIHASPVEVRVYHPLPQFLLSWRLGRGRGLQLAWRALFAINRRTHRKMAVVDGRVLWLGSLNLSAVHSERASGPWAWRDTGARLEGYPVTEAIAAFLRVWRRGWRVSATGYGTFRMRAPRPSGLLLVNIRRGERKRFRAELVSRIVGARQKVWITTAYFVPTRALLRALTDAARAGVDVRIIVPRVSDVPFMPWVSLAFYWALLRAGVHVHEYVKTILHAKAVVADEWLLVGSMNLNSRSLQRDLEVCACLRNPRSRQLLEANFMADMFASRIVTQDDVRSRPRWQLWVARFFLLFRGVL